MTTTTMMSVTTVVSHNTNLDSHGDVLFLGVEVVLVDVEHDDCVGQCKGRVCVLKGLLVELLWRVWKWKVVRL